MPRLHNLLIFSVRAGSPFESFANFSPHGFRLNGERWPTVDHFLLALRFAGEPAAAQIRQAPTVAEANRLAVIGMRHRALRARAAVKKGPDTDQPRRTDTHVMGHDLMSPDLMEDDLVNDDLVDDDLANDDLADDLTNDDLPEDGSSPITISAYAVRISRDQVRQDWLDKALLAKFRAHPKLAGLLLGTGRRTLLEEPPRCLPDHGKPVVTLNHLGLALMRVRTTLRRSAAQKRRPA